MIAAAAVGAGFGAGLLLLVLALGGPRRSLAGALAAVDAAAPVPADVPGGDGPGGPVAVPRDRWQRAERLLGDRLRGHGGAVRALLGGGLGADLHLLGLAEAPYAARKVAGAGAVLLVAPLPLSLLAAALGPPWLAGAWVAVLAAAAAFVLPDQRTRRAAAARRRSFLTTLTAYLDLVAMRAASGSGVPEALRDAASIGDGYAWRRLRAALEDARMGGQPPSAGLARLGEQIELAELRELASQLSLVDATGAQAEATLRAKAEALRHKELTQLHGDANDRSQSMVVGQVLLGTGFLVLIGYPAMAAVLAL